jgi:molecular chaperone Hsp33
MQDYMVRGTAAEGTVLAFAAVTTNLVSRASQTHKLSHVASAALGRTMTAAALMSMQLKSGKDTITIQIKGDGPLGGLVVVSDSKANVRGYVYNADVFIPLNNLGKLDVAGAIGKNGYLNVIRDLGLKEPYIGYVELISGEIAEDISYYFANSEQVPSVVSLGVLVEPDGTIRNAGGFIIQLMPGAEDEVIDFLERKIKNIKSITSMLEEGNTPEMILESILGGKGLKIAETSPCTFQCNCSRERMESNIASIGRKDILEIINEQHGAELQCHFCNKKYQFTENDLIRIIDGKSE